MQYGIEILRSAHWQNRPILAKRGGANQKKPLTIVILGRILKSKQPPGE